MKVLVMASGKGGVGKTTGTISLGTAFSRRGRRTLIADMDGQSSLTEYFYSREVKEAIKPSMAEMLLDRSKTVIVQPLQLAEKLYILPANSRLAEAELTIQSYNNPQALLRQRLRYYQQHFDVVVIDTPPATGLLTRNALGAADYAIIPIATEEMAYRTLPETLAQIDAIIDQEVNENLQLWHIIATMYDQREGEDKRVLQALRTEYEKFLYHEVMPRRTDYKKAVGSRSDISDFDKTLGAYWDRMAETIDNEIIVIKETA